MRKLREKLLVTAYKLKIIKFKLDEDPLKCWIYFLTFIESLEVIFYQYKKSCEFLMYYPKIGGEDIKYFVKKDIRNLLIANIDFHSRRFISELPVDGVKCILKLQSHCTNMNYSENNRYDRTFHQDTHKIGEPEMNYIKIFQNAQALSVSVGNSYSEYHLMQIFLDTFQ